MLYHYYSNIGYAIDVVKNNRIFLSSFKQQDDPFEYYIPFFYERVNSKKILLEKPLYIDKRNTKAGMFCLSPNNDDFIMWSKYCNDHKGVCIGFDFSDINLEFPVGNKNIKMKQLSDGTNIYLSVVNYNEKNKYQLVNGEAHLIGWEIIELYSRKFKCWSFQEEVRLLSLDISDEYYSLSTSNIKEVVFGIDYKEDTNQLIETLNSKPHIKILYENIDNINECISINTAKD